MAGHWENHGDSEREGSGENVCGGLACGSSSSPAWGKDGTLCVQGTRSSRRLLFARMMHMENDSPLQHIKNIFLKVNTAKLCSIWKQALVERHPLGNPV